MEYSFRLYGHENILSAHPTTIEFTKDAVLTRNGDCIVGVRAEFKLKKLLPFLQLPKIRITIEIDNITDSVVAAPNKDFSSNAEMVIRITDFLSPRTFAVRADKAAKHLNRKLITLLKQGKEAKATISNVTTI